MDEIKLVFTSRAVEPAAFASAISKLGQGGVWNPTLWTLRNTMRTMTGVELSAYVDRPSRQRFPAGIYSKNIEVFAPSSKEVIFVINGLIDSLSGMGLFEARRYVDRFLNSESSATSSNTLLVVGVGEVATTEKAVTAFCADLESAIKSSMDGRKARHLRFNWRDASKKLNDDRLDRFTDDESDVRFTRATDIGVMVHEQIKVMESPTVRTILREVAEAGFVRHSDLLGRRGKRQQEFDAALESIKKNALVQTEHILQCRKTSAQLVRVPDISELTAAATSNFRCATCNRPFSDELTSEGYSLSANGKELARGSHWMTLWVTEQLVAAGVDRSSILWNVEDAGEEVDIIIDHLKKTWIFELKDREFGAGDAYPFNYRKVRYKASEAVVVTTEKVAPDARRVFDDLDSKKPILIEGLDSFRPILEEAFKATKSLAIRNSLALPSAVTGIDLHRWFDAVNGNK